jgi:hypothetical protein
MVHLPCIYICEFCLKYRKSRKCLERHLVSVAGFKIRKYFQPTNQFIRFCKNVKMAVFWNVSSYSLVDTERCFRHTFCVLLHKSNLKHLLMSTKRHGDTHLHTLCHKYLKSYIGGGHSSHYHVGHCPCLRCISLCGTF